jgi:DNA-binding response OmpR family regulator
MMKNRKKYDMCKILLLEDDISLIDGLEFSLQKNDFTVETVRTVGEALKRLQNDDLISQYDLLLLDITLPDGTGFEVCERVRKENSRIPVIFLTASDEEVNVIRGLDGGGDDYITKPFKLGELCSRIRALLRRAGYSRQTGNDAPQESAQGSAPRQNTDNRIVSGGLMIDLTASRVTLDGKTLDLTRAEYRLICLLVRNAERVMTRDMIFNELWDHMGSFVDDNTLSVYIRRLREKIETDPSKPEHLITARGFGYRWVP